MKTQELYGLYERALGWTPTQVEAFRDERSGSYIVTPYRQTRFFAPMFNDLQATYAGNSEAALRVNDETKRTALEQVLQGVSADDVVEHIGWKGLARQLAYREALLRAREQLSDTEITPNLVTNQGLAHVLSSTLDAGTQITTWYLTMSSTNTAAANTMTAAAPVFTEITTTNVTETIRQTWTGGSVTGTTTASIDNSAAVATYTCNTAGFTAYAAALIGGGTSAFGNTAGTLYSYSLFASSKTLSSTDTIDVTYTFTATDV